ncbi:MAG: phage major capsid protein [Gammaproteobacteria bacterium]|nr:phage major capsid protein [Gammaproteobacteria bacterium]
MTTNSTAINDLYADVVADLIPFYDNMVLLPNQALILNSYNISGTAGDTVKIPTHDAYTAGATVAEGNQIITGASESDFSTTAASISVVKRGAGSFVTEESLEDGGIATVRTAVTTQLSRAIAQSTDIAGFRVALTNAETALTDISDVTVTTVGPAAGALTGADVAVVMSPEAMGYAMKREPTLKMFNDVDRDRHDMVATVRNGFVQVRPGFINGVVSSNVVAEATAAIRCNLDDISQAVTNLRTANAPTDASGFYVACVTPAQEYHLASQLNNVNVSGGNIGDLSMIGNGALLDGLIGQAVGCRFFRSNNLPTGLATA